MAIFGVVDDEGRDILATPRQGARTDSALQQGLYERLEGVRSRLRQDDHTWEGV